MPAEASTLSIRRLDTSDAAAFDRLRCAYARELGGPATPAPDFARALLGRSDGFVLGAVDDGGLQGFAVVFELPEAVHATICGGLDDLFVAADARGRGVARALIEAIVAEGRARGWSHLRWIVPQDDVPAIRLYERIAERAAFDSYMIRIDRTRSL